MATVKAVNRRLMWVVVVVVAGVLLLIGWIIFIRATFMSMGWLGIIVGAALFGCIVWLLVDQKWLSLDSQGDITWVVLVILSLILAVGMSVGLWSLKRQIARRWVAERLLQEAHDGLARRVREHKVYSQVYQPSVKIEKLAQLGVQGIILSGGPASIYAKGAPRVDRKIFSLGVPILGICYGMQYMMETLGGKVIGSKKREYGFAELNIKEQSGIFAGVGTATTCWMSHGDSVGALPEGFVATAFTDNTPVAAAQDAHPDLQMAVADQAMAAADRNLDDRQPGCIE